MEPHEIWNRRGGEVWIYRCPKCKARSPESRTKARAREHILKGRK
jgi:hypothetical protein